jgi:Tfp pilus assembly protein PilF
MNLSQETSVLGGTKNLQAATAMVRGQERFKQAREAVRRGHKDLARKALDAAIDAYSEAIRIDPKHASAYLLRARAYEEKGDEARAEADLVQAKALEAG